MRYMFAWIPKSSFSPEIDVASRSVAKGASAADVLFNIHHSKFETTRPGLSRRRMKIRTSAEAGVDIEQLPARKFNKEDTKFEEASSEA
jgi:hypothetical protein